MVIISVFQTDDAGSIPATRSYNIKAGVAKWLRQWVVVPPYAGSNPVACPCMISLISGSYYIFPPLANDLYAILCGEYYISGGVYCYNRTSLRLV